MAKVDKASYGARIAKLFADYKSFMIVNVDFVGSNTISRMRGALRANDAVFVKGKNSFIRYIMSTIKQEHPITAVAAHRLVQNVAMIFYNAETSTIFDLFSEYKEQADAKVGRIAPCDVTIMAGPTSMEVTEIQFLTKLGIEAKPAMGRLEITANKVILKEGQLVTASEATILAKLGMHPFFYQIQPLFVYEDNMEVDAAFFKDTDATMQAAVAAAIADVCSISLAAGFPTAAAMPHFVLDAFKNLQAVAADTEVSFKQVEGLKAFLADPSAFAAAAPVAAAAAPAAAAAAAKEESEEEDEGSDFGFGGLF